MDDLRQKLITEHMSFSSAAKLYDHLIENNKRSENPQSVYMKNLVDHQSQLNLKANHSLEKANSQQCLDCDKAIDCQVKCEEFNKDINEAK